MITAFSSAEAYDFKVCFDGLDLLKMPLGQQLMNEILKAEVIRLFTSVSSDSQDLLESIVAFCLNNRRRSEPNHPLPINLRDEYEVGLFTTGIDHPFRDIDYCMFNQEWLQTWSAGHSSGMFGIDWLVVPSRDRNGRINDIGFRVLDQSRVNDSLKWTFMLGQQATYGLHRATDFENLTLVEGAWDSIAFHQSGVPNVVGLGSVRITEGHLKYLEGTNYRTCWDQDSFGIAERAGSRESCFYSPAGKDPFEAWLTHGSVSLVTVGK